MRPAAVDHLERVASLAADLELTVLHLDKDFELIAEVTGQPVERCGGVASCPLMTGCSRAPAGFSRGAPGSTGAVQRLARPLQ